MSKKLTDPATSSSCGGGCTQQVQNGTKGMEKLFCNQQIQDQAETVMAPGRVQDWTQKHPGL